MTELLTAAQMRAIELAAIESGQVTGLELMERAGRGVVEAVFEEWPELAQAPHRAVVLCGPGNNGGDGFVVARLLKEWGWDVEVFLYGDPEKLPPDAKANYERWGELGEVDEYHWNLHMHISKAEAALVIDAVLGTGAMRPLDSTLYNSLSVLNVDFGGRPRTCRLVAIDIPTGLHCDSGLPLDFDEMGLSGFHADLTVTFQAAKLGQFLGGADGYCGKVVVKSIGLEGSPRPRVGVKPPPMGAVGGCPTASDEIVQLIEAPSNDLKKFDHEHKYTHGHALVLSGGSGRTGAARLAAWGALRVGAGLVTLGVPGSAQLEVAAQVTAVMLKRAGTAEELATALEDERINALCLGPGLGHERARELVPVALGAGRACVLDADALTAFGDEPEVLFDMLNEGCVLTPHGGEFARLFPDVAEKLNAPATKGPAYSKVDATREAAKRAGCIVLYKGADTVIADPEGRCSINAALYERSAPWLATAGSGDVLAGFITGLLARGFDPMQAAETGAWLHTECALSFGPGLVAEDLPEELPKVFRAIGA